MIFKASKAAAFVLIGIALSIWAIPKLASVRERPPASQQPAAKGPLYHLTLIPNYENKALDFEGSAPLGPVSSGPDTSGLPLIVGPTLPDEDTHTQYFKGTVRAARIVAGQDGYRVRMGPITLPPYRRLELSFPFVVLDPSRIRIKLHSSDQDSGEPSASPFSYEAKAVGLRIDWIDIPFEPIRKDIQLTLTPLIGEALAGNPNGLRLSGKVRFSALTFFQGFRDYCPDPGGVPPQTEYRRALLLDVLDFSPFSGRSRIPPIYSYQTTGVGLRTELVSCQYDTAKGAAAVDAIFFGKVFSSGHRQVPQELRDFFYPDGNYTYDGGADPPDRQGYQIWLDHIVLGPADTLTITVPHTQVLVDRITPPPDDLVVSALGQAEEPLAIVYHGPRAFKLVLPYLAEPQLYFDQFPALLRPGLSWVERQFGSLSRFSGSRSTWILLGIGISLLLLSRWRLNRRWIAALGWLLIAVSFYYGVRGSFGWLCTALAFYISQIGPSDLTPASRAALLRRLAAALAGFGLVALGVYLDRKGAFLFRNLSEHDLSPVTPLVLLLLVGALLFPLYGWTGTKSLRPSDMPVLIFFLAPLALYDAFDKSILSLLIFLAAFLYNYILRQAAADQASPAVRLRQKRRFQTELQRRWNGVFQNKTVVLAMLVLMIFAVGNDLRRIFANPIQVSLPPLVAVLAIPLLVFASVFLTFAGIALLFILVYPYLPWKQGYLKAAVFALILFLIFLFGIGTDDRLIEFLPNLLIGRVIFYLSIPLLIGMTSDIYEFMARENKRLAAQGGQKGKITFQEAAVQYLRHLQGVFGTLAGIASLAAPVVYGYFSNQPVIVTYFSLLQKLMLMPN